MINRAAELRLGQTIQPKEKRDYDSSESFHFLLTRLPRTQALGLGVGYSPPILWCRCHSGPMGPWSWRRFTPFYGGKPLQLSSNSNDLHRTIRSKGKRRSGRCWL